MFILKMESRQLDARLKEMSRRVEDLSPVMQEAVDLTNKSVLQEFTGSFYRTPSGAARGWADHVEFGTAPRGRLLWNRGRLKAAMTGGPGSTKRVTKKSFAYGIEKGKTFSAANKDKPITLGEIVAIHRGGLGLIPNESQVTVVRAKELISGADSFSGTAPQKFKMYWKLRNAYGVRLSHQKMTEGLRIPARPFATMNAPLRKSIAYAVKDYILSLSGRGSRR